MHTLTHVHSRVKECSIDTVCNLCLGQNGPLSVGSASGSQSRFGVSNLQFVLSCILSGEEDDRGHLWQWWLGRVSLLDRLIARFTLEFLLANCVVKSRCHSCGDLDSECTSSSVTSLNSLTSNASTLVESQVWTSTESGHLEHEVKPGAKCAGMESGLTASSDTIPSCTKLTVENNLLVSAWYFAAKATHISHHKLGRVGRRVIIRIAKVLRDHPSSLEVVHDVISKCHRTQAEGLLDRVLKVREKPHEAGNHRSTNSDERQPREAAAAPRSAKRTLLPKSPELLSDPESPLLALAGAVPSNQSAMLARSDKIQRMEKIGEEGELVASDDSFRSAVSDLEGEGDRRESSEGLEASSSASNSHDSKSGGEKGAKERGVASGGKLLRYVCVSVCLSVLHYVHATRVLSDNALLQ